MKIKILAAAGTIVAGLTLVSIALPFASGIESTPAHAAESKTDSIVWEDNFDVALKKARAQNKLVLVNFWAPWCGQCRKLDAEVLSQRNVVAESRHFVNVKVDVSKREDLYARYKLTGTPTLAFLRADGQTIHSSKGLPSPGELARRMRAVRR